MERWILKPGPGFHEPVEMLDACHERMRRHCQTLEKLVTHLGMTGADESARQAAANVIRYFDQSALDHHADEEVNLFPLLRDFASQPKQDVLIQQMDWLIGDHRRLEQAWKAIRPRLEAIQAGRQESLDAHEVACLCDSYEHHLFMEETWILPFAKAHLTAGQLQELGQAMAQRRGDLRI